METKKPRKAGFGNKNLDLYNPRVARVTGPNTLVTEIEQRGLTLKKTINTKKGEV